jgi:hypothetical protein
LKLSEMTCREGIIAVAKMYVPPFVPGTSVFHFAGNVSCLLLGKAERATNVDVVVPKTCLWVLNNTGICPTLLSCSIYEVHDEAKDKAFELELSWVCDESNKQHQRVPADLLEEAKVAAKAAKDALDEDEGMDAD